MGDTGPNNNLQDKRQSIEIERVSPPPYLSPKERDMWTTIVSTLPADHFSEADIYILQTFIKAYCIMMEAVEELEINGHVLVDQKGKEYRSPWSNILVSQQLVVTNLATKLRITPGSRVQRTQSKVLYKTKTNSTPIEISNYSQIESTSVLEDANPVQPEPKDPEILTREDLLA